MTVFKHPLSTIHKYLFEDLYDSDRCSIVLVMHGLVMFNSRKCDAAKDAELGADTSMHL
jgi:hypothetical protein